MLSEDKTERCGTEAQNDPGYRCGGNPGVPLSPISNSQYRLQSGQVKEKWPSSLRLKKEICQLSTVVGDPTSKHCLERKQTQRFGLHETSSGPRRK